MPIPAPSGSSAVFCLKHADKLFSLVAGRAEKFGIGPGALVIEMIAHFPGKADRSEHLDAAEGHRAILRTPGIKGARDRTGAPG